MPIPANIRNIVPVQNNTSSLIEGWGIFDISLAFAGGGGGADCD